jgi:hypothetical protein
MRDVVEEFEAAQRAKRKPPPAPVVEVSVGATVRHRGSRFLGRVVRLTAGTVELRDDRGNVRAFPVADGGFEVEGRTVTIRARRTAAATAPTRTASGSIAGPTQRATVAKASRLLVEGVHDAELIEQVWGDDLRDAGIVVERLDGIDHLGAWLDAFQPGATRRVGVLVDHLVAGSKEERLVTSLRRPGVLVTGTPYVDVWQAVRPHVVGIDAWPVIPKGQDWKTGITAHLARHGWSEREPRDVWRRLKASVRSYADLEPALVGAVEQLLDFVIDDE